MTSEISRRHLLAAGGTVLAAAVVAGCMDAGVASVPGEAAHPALLPPPGRGELALLRLPAGDAAARAALLAVARAAAGPAAATVTLGVAASAPRRAGMASAVPEGLRAMPSFVGDVLDPRRVGADLVLQTEADRAAVATAAMDAVLARASGVSISWRTRVARSAVGGVARPRPLVRNPFGFVEGQSNLAVPDPAAEAALLPASATVPAWAAGGSFLALRVVRLARDLWDNDPVEVQERIVGRRRDGRWLDGSPTSAPPPFAADPDGRVTPLDAHVRMANPRTAADPHVQLLRRSWAYPAQGATGDEGLLFMAYCDDLAKFETVQRRLAGEPMSRYTLTVGGGYFLVPRRVSPSWAEQLAGTTPDR